MNIYRICFCGHRKIYDCPDLEEKIEELVVDAIREQDYVEFYVGKNGDFDTSVASAVKRAQKKLGNDNSSLILVQPYKMSNDEYYESYFDEIIYPISSNTHFKAAITERNRWMIELADLFVCFVRENNNGGASYALDYAIKIGKEVINLANPYLEVEEERNIRKNLLKKS